MTRHLGTDVEDHCADVAQGGAFEVETAQNDTEW